MVVVELQECETSWRGPLFLGCVDFGRHATVTG